MMRGCCYRSLSTSASLQALRRKRSSPSRSSRFDLGALQRATSKNPTNPIKIPSALRFRQSVKDNASFSKLGLREEVVRALENMNMETPTGVQVMAIPPLLERKNVLFAAETGTGKTVAYLAPVVHHLRHEEDVLGVLRRPQRPRAVVLVPSRELVHQVSQVAKSISHVAKFRVEQVTDRKPKNKAHFEGLVDMVVGLPSKIMQNSESGLLSYADVRYVVVDEADTLLEKDFGEQVREFLGRLNHKPHPDLPLQLIFTSATIPKSLNDFVDREFPGQFVKFASPRLHRTLPGLRQRFIPLEGFGDNKQKTLLKILFELPPRDDPTIIFCNTLGNVRALEAWITSVPEAVEMAGGDGKIVCLHARIPREEREEIYERFKRGEISTLLCTDIASRGLDSLDIKHVILYDFPFSAIDYLHRVGRTARNGNTGRATSLVAKRDRPLAQQIETAIRRKESIS